ncbi:chorismate synthase [Rubeoparvulum massiliense]|uniref:chorismate synthase n=1 Tax=Rubeoparvulum massiliense TaxID=1631346 RepID=UPI00065DCB48|nr:chorismate synthase [Rubeoparvulum massiliense]
MRMLTAGESHGPQLTAIIEGVPSHFQIDVERINEALRARQGGYGRGRRMEIEQDQVEILSGIRNGVTTGSPITLAIINRDYTHWQHVMSPLVQEEFDPEQRRVSKPRPGHADLTGGLKYQHRDLRNVLERASARETAIRVAVGALMKELLRPFQIQFLSRVLAIGGVVDESNWSLQPLSSEEQMRWQKQVTASPVRCLDEEAAQQMIQRIDAAKAAGDSLGGLVEVQVLHLPPGLGSFVQWDRKLDGRLAQAILSIQAFKGVEIGDGFELAHRPGSEAHDEIAWEEGKGFYHLTNHAGGIEGGMSNGEPIRIRAVMKPIPTLYKPLRSVDIDSKEPFAASVERSDACAVPAASIVAEHVVAWEIGNAFFDKFHGDSYGEVAAAYQWYLQQVQEY